jgi:hypothetical protein
VRNLPVLSLPALLLLHPLVAGLTGTGTVACQDLPPGVLLLSRIKSRTRQELQRLADVCCLETVQREYQPPGGRMRPLDTVRLEVLYDGRQELFASPGGRKFSGDHPISYAGSGVLGNGFFALHLKSILLGGQVSNQYRGEEDIGGRRLARYDYRLPLMWSGQIIKSPEGSGRVGLHGSYWADPGTYDVVRLELIAEDIPPAVPFTAIETSINYARTNLGNNSTLLLPESAELHIVKTSGEASRSRIEFTHCRSFEVQSAIAFGTPDSPPETPRFGVKVVDDTLRPMPAGLEITVKLRSRISTGMAVGTLIDGVVEADVPGKGVPVIAAGSPVRGRIRRLEGHTDPVPHFVVALEFTEVESNGIRYRFFADPVGIGPALGVERNLSIQQVSPAPGMAGRAAVQSVTRTSTVLSLHDLPGVASFFYRGSRLELPAGFRTAWKTRPWAP